MDATISAPGPLYSSTMARNLAVACAMAAMFMQTLDQTIANVALPHMQGSLSASRDQITWVLTSYIIASAIMTAPVGWIASRFGKRRFILVAVVGFTVTSALCGLAQNLDQIIVFRLLQGAFGAALGPLSQTIMMDMFPPQSRGSVMGIWGMGVMLGPILGPTLGGYLTDAFSWRWVFYINVPVGIAAMIGLWLFYRDPGRDRVARVRLARFQPARAGTRRVAVDARSRHAQRLVQFDGNRDRGRGRAARSVSVRRCTWRRPSGRSSGSRSSRTAISRRRRC